MQDLFLWLESLAPVDRCQFHCVTDSSVCGYHQECDVERIIMARRRHAA